MMDYKSKSHHVSAIRPPSKTNVNIGSFSSSSSLKQQLPTKSSLSSNHSFSSSAKPTFSSSASTSASTARQPFQRLDNKRPNNNSVISTSNRLANSRVVPPSEKKDIKKKPETTRSTISSSGSSSSSISSGNIGSNVRTALPLKSASAKDPRRLGSGKLPTPPLLMNPTRSKNINNTNQPSRVVSKAVSKIGSSSSSSNIPPRQSTSTLSNKLQKAFGFGSSTTTTTSSKPSTVYGKVSSAPTSSSQALTRRLSLAKTGASGESSLLRRKSISLANNVKQSEPLQNSALLRRKSISLASHNSLSNNSSSNSSLLSLDRRKSLTVVEPRKSSIYNNNSNSTFNGNGRTINNKNSSTSSLSLFSNARRKSLSFQAARDEAMDNGQNQMRRKSLLFSYGSEAKKPPPPPPTIRSSRLSLAPQRTITSSLHNQEAKKTAAPIIIQSSGKSVDELLQRSKSLLESFNTNKQVKKSTSFQAQQNPIAASSSTKSNSANTSNNSASRTVNVNGSESKVKSRLDEILEMEKRLLEIEKTLIQ